MRPIGIQTAVIMTNNYICHSADSTERKCEFAMQNHFAFPYLLDETRSVAKAYVPVYSPDFFGFNSNLELQDRGRLGNLTMDKGDTLTPKIFVGMSMIAATDSGSEKQVAVIGLLTKV